MFIINNLQSRGDALSPLLFQIFCRLYDIDVYSENGTIIPFHEVTIEELHSIVDAYINDVQLINLSKV